MSEVRDAWRIAGRWGLGLGVDFRNGNEHTSDSPFEALVITETTNPSERAEDRYSFHSIYLLETWTAEPSAACLSYHARGFPTSLYMRKRGLSFFYTKRDN